MKTQYRKVADLDLSIRTKSLLRNAGIDTLQELTSYTKSDLMKFRNFGRRSLIELEDLMLKNNLSFGTMETIKTDHTAVIQTLESKKDELFSEALDNIKDYLGPDVISQLESIVQKHKQ